MTADDVRLAHREGFVSVEHLKRYTTLGMATDQGKTSNVPGLAIMAEALGKPIPEVGTTRFRPPFAPVSLGALAAERYGDLKPERLTPMHDWHVEHGATMYAAGLWFRPMIYGRRRNASSRPMCARPARRAKRPASSMSRRSARSPCRGRTRPISSTASTPTSSRRCRSARRATG